MEAANADGSANDACAVWSTGNVLGLGHDVVGVDGFACQLAEPGSRMRQLFSPRELRQAAWRAKVKHDDEAAHLAVRWAGKEAVLKAWCEALGERPNPYTLDDFPWSSIEILGDSRSRPHVVLAPACEAKLDESLGMADNTDSVDSKDVRIAGITAVLGSTSSLEWRISLTHDAGIASAVVLLTLVSR